MVRMMKEADVVIGAGYGDEGKGHAVSQLVGRDSLVVRFNGGAQAGHTVVHGRHRHVFSHFGASRAVDFSLIFHAVF